MKKPINQTKINLYMLGGDEDGNIWLMKSHGEVKITPKRAMEWLEAGIDMFDRTRDEMKKYIQKQMKEIENNAR